jgi:hypothetical protein
MQRAKPLHAQRPRHLPLSLISVVSLKFQARETPDFA